MPETTKFSIFVLITGMAASAIAIQTRDRANALRARINIRRVIWESNQVVEAPSAQRGAFRATGPAATLNRKHGPGPGVTGSIAERNRWVRPQRESARHARKVARSNRAWASAGSRHLPSTAKTLRSPPIQQATASGGASTQGQGVTAQEGVMARGLGPALAVAATKEQEDLPELPDRHQVVTRMTQVRSKIRSCYDKGLISGEVTVNLTVLGRSGRVVQAEVSPPSTISQCVEQVVLNVTFPRFAREQATIRLPYVFE